MVSSTNPALKYKYNGKELQDELGLNAYDYGARFYDSATSRWFSVDAFAEKYYSESPYIYALNNPVLYVDPDGNQVEMCCDGLYGFISQIYNNATGRKRDYSNESQEFRNGVTSGDYASIAGGSLLAAKGLIDMDAGGAAMGGALMAVVDSGGAATEVAAPVFIAGGLTFLVGMLEVKAGTNMYMNAMSNITENSSSSGDSSSSSSSQKTGDGRGSNNRTADPDAVGDHTVVNENGSTTYKVNQNNPNKNNNGLGFETEKRVDYKGASDVDKKTGNTVPTPHVHENGSVRPAIPGQDMPKNLPNN